jgi:hypothetical protein
LATSLVEIEQWLDEIYIAAEGATLRNEDRRKAVEVKAMLDEIELAISRFSKKTALSLIDAAAGKSYVGLLAAKLILDPSGRNATVLALERDPLRVNAGMVALKRLNVTTPVGFSVADVANREAWPEQISLLTALHACGPAADAIIDRAIELRARQLLLVPCCTSSAMPMTAKALELANEMNIPRHAPVRRRFIQSMVDSERTLRLEAAGFETEVVEFVPPTVTPHNLLWRARYVGEPRRMQAAQQAIIRFLTTRSTNNTK